jgi:ribose 5-phosphate isomerase B
MKLVIGADHRGFHLKLLIQEQIRNSQGTPVEWLDAGCFTAEQCDYPEFAAAAVKEIKAGNAQGGVLLCGSGVGMSIAANRFAGIYAALVWNETTAQKAKEHDGANILVLPADYINNHDAVTMIHSWISAQFLGQRYQQRLQMLEELAKINL